MRVVYIKLNPVVASTYFQLFYKRGKSNSIKLKK